MRDPKRIPVVLKKLEAYWLKFPDLRLGQILANMSTGGDSFFLEDGELIEKLEQQTAANCLHPGTFRGSVCETCGLMA